VAKLPAVDGAVAGDQLVVDLTAALTAAILLDVPLHVRIATPGRLQLGFLGCRSSPPGDPTSSRCVPRPGSRSRGARAAAAAAAALRDSRARAFTSTQ
jgi:hypothetical protein